MGYNSNYSLLHHLSRFIGQTVTIFTTSGGASGCGFTGILMSVNPCFVRLVTKEGSPPANPLSDEICDFDNAFNFNGGCDKKEGSHRRRRDFDTGSVCDIPVDKIASFCHNAV
ncbi:MAG TPA: hypothetical protein GXZ28_06915 [Clostridiales bacterium]|jgi:hypothetical protein|nr:hypothetical protein [Clostridiales bacterium]